MRAPTPTAAAEMAVPVRADLMAMLTEQGLRMNRAVRRGAAQARERLDMHVRLMPTPDTLLAPQRQRLDQLSDNLGNCLRHRVADARVRLGHVSGALRRPLLDRLLDRSKERLDRLRLRPDYLTRVFHDRATAFDRLSRLFVSVNPDLPLQRGFARVMAGDRLVKTVADARAAGAVSLHFADGAIAAAIEGGSPPPPLEKPPGQAISASSRPARKAQEGGETRQQDLFS
jgi:exodeoxyribonuclease VII large subunit